MLPRYLTRQLLLLDDFSSALEPASKMFSTLFLSSKFASMVGEWSVDFCEDFGRLLWSLGGVFGLSVYLIGFGHILVLTFSSNVESIGNSTLSSDGMYRKLRELLFSIERECLARLLTSGTDDFTKWCDTFFCCIFSVTSLSASQRVTRRTLCCRVTWATCARYTWRWCHDDWNLGMITASLFNGSNTWVFVLLYTLLLFYD